MSTLEDGDAASRTSLLKEYLCHLSGFNKSTLRKNLQQQVCDFESYEKPGSRTLGLGMQWGWGRGVSGSQNVFFLLQSFLFLLSVSSILSILSLKRPSFFFPSPSLWSDNSSAHRSSNCVLLPQGIFYLLSVEYFLQIFAITGDD